MQRPRVRREKGLPRDAVALQGWVQTVEVAVEKSKVRKALRLHPKTSWN